MDDGDSGNEPTSEVPAVEPAAADSVPPSRRGTVVRAAALVGAGLLVGVIVMLAVTAGGDDDDVAATRDAAATDDATSTTKDAATSSETAVVALEGEAGKPAAGGNGSGAKPDGGSGSGGQATTPATTAPSTTAATTSTTASSTTTTTVATTPATINFSLPPVHGSTSLTSGFVPDPFNVGVTAGGPASVSYLGGGCTGFTTSAPSLSVNYVAGAFPTLRFYFIGGGDTTMVINTPGGSYVCVDDSFGTLNPTIDFNSPASGRYDVWVATYAPGGSIAGTLYVTENTGNHP